MREKVVIQLHFVYGSLAQSCWLWDKGDQALSKQSRIRLMPMEQVRACDAATAAQTPEPCALARASYRS
jgi:hypothetical protein